MQYALLKMPWIWLFLTLLSVRAYSTDFDTLCNQNPTSCLTLLDEEQSQLAVGSDAWWQLETVRLTWLFEFHRVDDLYAALRPWVNNPTVPSAHQPFIAMLHGKWLIIKGRTEEAKTTFTQAFEGYLAVYSKSPTQHTALKVLNLLVALNQLKPAEDFVEQLVEQDYDDPAFYREVYAELGHIAHRTDDHIKHVEYRLASLNWAKQVDDEQQIGVALNNYGVALRNSGDYKKAREAFLNGLERAEIASDTVRIHLLHLRLAEVAFKEGDLEQTFSWLNKTDINHLPAAEFKRLRSLTESVRQAKQTAGTSK